MPGNEIHIDKGLMVHLLCYCEKDASAIQRSLGISPQNVRDILDGVGDFSPLKGNRVADLCGFEVDELRFVAKNFRRFLTHIPLKEGAKCVHPVRGEGSVLSLGSTASVIKLNEKSRLISDVPNIVFHKVDIDAARVAYLEVKAPPQPAAAVVEKGRPAPLKEISFPVMVADVPATLSDTLVEIRDVPVMVPDVPVIAGEPVPPLALLPSSEDIARELVEHQKMAPGTPDVIPTEAFRRLVQASGKTRKELALGAGVNISMIGFYSSGKYKLPRSRLAGFLKAAGLTEKDFQESLQGDLVVKRQETASKPSTDVAVAVPAEVAVRPDPEPQAIVPAAADEYVNPVKIRFLIHKSTRSESKIADAFPCHKATLTAYKSGRYRLAAWKFQSLASACGFTVEQALALLAGREPAPAPPMETDSADPFLEHALRQHFEGPDKNLADDLDAEKIEEPAETKDLEPEDNVDPDVTATDMGTADVFEAGMKELVLVEDDVQPAKEDLSDFDVVDVEAEILGLNAESLPIDDHDLEGCQHDGAETDHQTEADLDHLLDMLDPVEPAPEAVCEKASEEEAAPALVIAGMTELLHEIRALRSEMSEMNQSIKRDLSAFDERLSRLELGEEKPAGDGFAKDMFHRVIAAALQEIVKR